MSKSLGIIDIGIGNVRSVQNMIYACDIESNIINSPNQLLNYNKIILPGVGSFDSFMSKLKDLDFIEPLRKLVLSKKIYILGICLGMHVLFDKSEEGKLNGLSLIDGEIQKLDNNKIKIPHNGWNKLSIQKESKLLRLNDDLRFYFNHSYFLRSTNKTNILSTTNYNIDFISGIELENIIGVQFHPEKSHNYGKLFFKRFNSI